MKIYFDNVNFSSRSGPNSAALRMAKALVNRGHEIADADDYDVALVYIEPTHLLNRKKPYVQRLDGIWLKPEEYIARNASIKLAYKSAAGVIFKSQFGKELITHAFGSSVENHVVINNGIDLNDVKYAIQNVSLDLKKLRAQYEVIYVCSASWRPNKRLKDIVMLFEHAVKITKKNSCLLILGQNPDYISRSPHVFYTGDVEHDVCLKIYSEADWMIHLCWLDNSPNVVAEAVACGCGVICNATAGTREIIEGTGIEIIIPEDVWSPGPCNNHEPPKIDVTHFTGLREITDTAAAAARHRVDINRIAAEYERVLEVAQ